MVTLEELERLPLDDLWFVFCELRKVLIAKMERELRLSEGRLTNLQSSHKKRVEPL